MASKAANYCAATPSSPQGLLLLARVALGNCHKCEPQRLNLTTRNKIMASEFLDVLGSWPLTRRSNDHPKAINDQSLQTAPPFYIFNPVIKNSKPAIFNPKPWPFHLNLAVNNLRPSLRLSFRSRCRGHDTRRSAVCARACCEQWWLRVCVAVGM